MIESEIEGLRLSIGGISYTYTETVSATSWVEAAGTDGSAAGAGAVAGVRGRGGV